MVKRAQLLNLPLMNPMSLYNISFFVLYVCKHLYSLERVKFSVPDLFAEFFDFRRQLLLSLTPRKYNIELALAVLKIDRHTIAEHPQDQPERWTSTSPCLGARIASPGVLDQRRALFMKGK